MYFNESVRTATQCIILGKKPFTCTSKYNVLKVGFLGIKMSYLGVQTAHALVFANITNHTYNHALVSRKLEPYGSVLSFKCLKKLRGSKQGRFIVGQVTEQFLVFV